MNVTSGQWNYYVITGTATVASDEGSTELPTGQFAGSQTDEAHTISNDGEQRLIILAVGG